MACVIMVIEFLMLSSAPPLAGETPSSLTIDDLRAEVQALQQEADRLEEENSGLHRMISDLEKDDLYLVVDTESNRLTMRQGNAAVHTAKCGTGSRHFMKAETGTKWYFETPMGSFKVLGKERNPVWIRPDWSYVEENMPIPPAGDPDRFVRGVLGKYALILGNGYKIHGTKWKKLLGTHFTHGCVSLGDDDLELIHNSVEIGTRVYLY